MKYIRPEWIGIRILFKPVEFETLRRRNATYCYISNAEKCPTANDKSQALHQPL